MLRDELIAFEQLSGEDASLKTIGRIGGFLDGYQKAMEKQQWIPCSERPPEEDGRYYVTRHDYVSKTEFIDILWYEKNLWWNRRATGDYAVIAWMPLPEPYMGEQT